MAQENGKRKVIRLTAERLRRLERRMDAVEQAQRGTNARLEQAIDVLTRLVRVVAVQNGRMNRNLQQLTTRIDNRGGRLDRFARSVMTGRTTDNRRLVTLGRNMEALERRLG